MIKQVAGKPKSGLWAVAAMADDKKGETYITPLVVKAVSYAEALGKGRLVAEQEFPQDDGWGRLTVEAISVDDVSEIDE